MGNQIALRLLTQPGQEIICESRAHILDYEMATAAVFSGCLIRAVPTKRGTLTWKDIEAVIYGRGTFHASTGCIEIENTANLTGGRVTSLPIMEEIWNNAKERKLPVHLDGARIFNAATALGIDVKTLTRGFDTVMFCLSKGLCAPVGSMLVGSRESMDQARIYRKALGGGMRQAGVLAAAGLIALETMPARLNEDHANARLLAEAISHIDGISIDLDAVETNIVIFHVTGNLSAPDLIERLKMRGILASTIGPDAIRLVSPQRREPRPVHYGSGSPDRRNRSRDRRAGVVPAGERNTCEGVPYGLPPMGAGGWACRSPSLMMTSRDRVLRNREPRTSPAGGCKCVEPPPPRQEPAEDIRLSSGFAGRDIQSAA